MIRSRMLAVCALLALAISTGAAQHRNTGKAHRTALQGGDLRFVMNAAKGGVAEVDFGKLAAERSSDQRVKDFGNRMVKDHSQANEELGKVASSKGFTVPTAMAANDKRMYDRLSHLSGATFDRDYMQMMVRDHEKDVKDFEKESRDGKDADVRSFASKTLPTLKEHLEMARSIAGGAAKSHAHPTKSMNKGMKKY